MSFYQRNLPHYQPMGYAYFITTRLQGTIPRNIYQQLKTEYETNLRTIAQIKNTKEKLNRYYTLHKEFFEKYEKILDSGDYGKTWLRNKKVAEAIKSTFYFYDNDRYNLICYTIMPNHIHLIILPKIESYQYFLKEHISKGKSEKTFYFISKIMQDIKKFTSNKSNKILNRSGKFWQSESYDHAIRNKNELLETVRYVLDNPVKAGLCKTSEDWEWNYYNPKFLV